MDATIFKNSFFNSSLVIPFSASKFSPKLGNEKLPFTIPPWKGNLFVAISKTELPPRAPGEVAYNNIGFS